MNIKDININLLKEYENNPRLNDETVDYVVESIKEFGFKVPIVIDKNNVIVTGHTRVKAAKKLNLKEVPCIVADDLTPEQIKAFRLVDNKVAEYSTWDTNKLNVELQELETSEINMSDLGFSTYDSIKKDNIQEVNQTETIKNETKYQYKCPRCGYEW